MTVYVNQTNDYVVKTVQITQKEYEEKENNQTVKTVYTTRASHTVQTPQSVAYATFVQEITYEDRTLGGYSCYKITNFGHRVSSYDSSQGTPTQLNTSITQSSQIAFTSSGTSSSSGKIETTSNTKTSAWTTWTRQNTGFSYFMADYGSAYAKAYTTFTWHNFSGSNITVPLTYYLFS